MELKHNFSVPTGIAEIWRQFGDPQGLAECFPGAQVTSVEGDSFTGTAKVKLGPIVLVYTGTGEYAERDESTHRLVVTAKGKDKRGNGTAGATVTVQLSEAGPEQTDVDVLTDLNVTGKPAQFGRGMIQDVSDKLLGQFVDCLEKKLTGAEPQRAASGDGPSVDQSGSQADPGGPSESRTTDSAAVPPPTRSMGTEEPPPLNEERPRRATESPVQAPRQGQAPQHQAPSEGGQQGQATKHDSRQEADDSLDLGATVLPVLVKHYWREGLIVFLALLVLRGMFRRGR